MELIVLILKNSLIHKNIKYEKCLKGQNLIKNINNFDILFMASAVADYSPSYSKNKIKKNDDKLILELNKTTDILKSLKK